MRKVWYYELAHAMQDGIYTDWREHVGFDKPNVPRGSIRNLELLGSRSKAVDLINEIKADTRELAQRVRENKLTQEEIAIAIENIMIERI